MAEEASKGLFQRIIEKAGDKLGEKLAESIATLGVWTLLGAWATDEWSCIRQPRCEVAGWFLGVLIAITMLLAAAVFFLAGGLLRTRRELSASKAVPTKTKSRPATPPFEPIRVEDHRLILRWYIRRRPAEWLHWRNIERTIGTEAVLYVLDGPFHARPGCNAALAETHGKGINEQGPPAFAEHCTTCGRNVFQGYSGSVSRVRAQALEEVLRMERNAALEGRTLLDAPFILERPQYWDTMHPPQQNLDGGPP